MKSVRSVIFWMHLCCGVAAGVVVHVMLVYTGSALACRRLSGWLRRENRAEADSSEEPARAA